MGGDRMIITVEYVIAFCAVYGVLESIRNNEKK